MFPKDIKLTTKSGCTTTPAELAELAAAAGAAAGDDETEDSQTANLCI